VLHRNQIPGSILRRTCTAASALGLGTALLSGVATTPASAIPLPPSTSSCTYNGSPIGFPASNTKQTSVTVVCTGLPPSTQLIVAQASPLAGVISPSTSAPTEADLNTAAVVTTDSTGALTATIMVTATGTTPAFSATDSHAVCPPTQAQVNAGLTNCVVTVANLATATGFNFGNIIYGTQPSPNNPTLRLHKGTPMTATDARHACPTPVKASSHCWWGAALTGAPNGAVGVPGFTVVLNATTVGNTLAASPAVYCALNATAAACAGLKTDTLIGPHLSGTITLPASPEGTVTALEPNTTPDPGNGPSNTVAASTLLR